MLQVYNLIIIIEKLPSHNHSVDLAFHINVIKIALVTKVQLIHLSSFDCT